MNDLHKAVEQFVREQLSLSEDVVVRNILIRAEIEGYPNVELELNEQKEHEDKVVSLELAKELEEAGYEQEGACWWIIPGNSKPVIVSREKRYTTTFIHTCYVAPTTAELLDRLPNDCYICEKNLWYRGRNIEINHIDNDLDKPLDYLTAFTRMWLRLKRMEELKKMEACKT